MIFLVLAIEPEDIAKKAKTHETNEMAMKHLSHGFELSCMTVPLAALRHAERLLFVHGRLI